MSVFSYLRVSTDQQDVQSQRHALSAAGIVVNQEYVDTMSGSKNSRPALDALLATVRRGDVIVVYRLDRLGRSMLHLVRTVLELEAKGVTVRSLSESLDTSTTIGKLVLSLYAGMAQLERESIVERTKAGMAAARARGVTLGASTAVLRPLGVRGRATQLKTRSEHAKSIEWILQPLVAEGRSCREIARVLNERGVPTITGNGQWLHGSVKNAVGRLMSAS